MPKKSSYIRKQLLLSREQAERLKVLAREDGVSVSQLIREAVDFVIALSDPEMKALLRKFSESVERDDMSRDSASNSNEVS